MTTTHSLPNAASTVSLSSSFSDRSMPISAEVTKLDRIPYKHGAYAAAAPFFHHDKEFNDILLRLMPDAHDSLQKLLCSNGNLKVMTEGIMRWAENNPCAAAYGVLWEERSEERKHRSKPNRTKSLFHFGSPNSSASTDTQSSNKFLYRMTPLEWDVFLDPYLVQRVDAAMQAAQERRKSPNNARGKNDTSRITAENEVERLVAQLIRRMVLAHGSTAQLVAEALGIARQYTFARVEKGARTSKVRGTAMFVEMWLTLFATTLKISKHKKVEVKEIPKAPISPAPQMCGMFLCLFLGDDTTCNHEHDSLQVSVKEIMDLIGSKMRIVLDLKSRRVPARVWARLIDNLRTRGLEIEGVGSFDISELRNISRFGSIPVAQIIFFHSAGDLQRACHSGKIRRGDTVYFNAGSLLTERRSILSVTEIACCASPTASDMLREFPKTYKIQPFAEPKHLKQMVPPLLAKLESSRLEDYQRYFDLKIGVYVQEFSISSTALDVLSNFINDNHRLYQLGMAWGGINGKTVDGIKGDGYWNQRYVGHDWDEHIGPTDKMMLTHGKHDVGELVLDESCGLGAVVGP